MKQHPIPQDITNYRFHLIGSMTLKQFAEVAAAVIVALIVYATNLPGIIKWPLIIFIIFLGILIAFVPIEERPLDHWIMTFFKNLYRPTKFFWKKSSKAPDFFQYQVNANTPSYIAPDVDLSPARKERIFEYLKSIPREENTDTFDQAEEQKVSALLSQFGEVDVKNPVINKKQQLEKPNLKTRIRKIKIQEDDEDAEKAMISETEENHPSVLANEATISQPAEMSVDKTLANVPSETKNFISNTEAQTNPLLDNGSVVASEDILPKTQEENNQNGPLQEIQMPIAKTDESSDSISSLKETAPSIPEVSSPQGNLSEETEQAAQPAETAIPNTNKKTSQFNPNLPFPTRPSIPNKLVGMVLDQQDALLPGALVEVIDENGQSSRVVKTNDLGQFFISTPLRDGKYALHVEADARHFQDFAFELTGKIVPPVELRSEE
jgi:hypothetical protein